MIEYTVVVKYDDETVRAKFCERSDAEAYADQIIVTAEVRIYAKITRIVQIR